MPLSPEAKELLKQKGISAISDPGQKIRVYVETEEDIAKLPSFISGYSVEPIVSGRFFALQDRTGRWRPAPGGVSIGHVNITAGTLGSRVIDLTTGKRLILSNNHVLANANLGKAGDPILQPGPYDGGSDPTDRIALLERFIEIKGPPEENLVDAALASPLNDADLSDDILGIGAVTGIENATVGMRVGKSGRTSGYTEAIISDVSATIKVYGYPFPEEYAIFNDQIITSLLGQPGDSGSLVVNTATKNAVGLLFAGSDTLTSLNKITNCCNLLNIKFGEQPPPSRPIWMPMIPFMLAIPAYWFGGKE